MSRRAVLLIAVLVAVACTEQPTEPTKTETPFQAVLGPAPAPPTPLSTTVPAANGAPSLQELGFYEAPTISRVTVSGLLNYANPDGAGSGYLPGSGQIDAEGIYVPQGNYCALQLSVRVTGYGRIGGYDGTSCPHIQQIGSITNYAVISGQIVAQRLQGPPGSCYFGGFPCTTITGEEQVEVVPETADLALTSLKTIVGPGGLILVVANPSPAYIHGIAVPWSIREWRWEGSGPTVGGGQTKVCSSYPTPTSCYVTMYQSGNVVLEAVVNGVVRTERMWLEVIGGDTVPPQPKDTVPTDTIPSDTTHGGGGGGGGGCGAPSLRSAAGPMRVCDPPPSKIRVLLVISQGLMSPLVTRASFDAVNQTNFRVVRGAREDIDGPRPDTMTVKVVLRREDNGEVVPNAAILLTAAPIDSSGGHIHTKTDRRPTGSFFLDGENSQIRGPGIHQGQVTLTTNDQGEASVVYRSSGLAGRERFIATLQSGGTPVGPDTAAIVLKVQGLTEMDSSVAGRYAFKPQDEAIATQRHGNHNRWVQAAFKDSVLLIFKDYFTNGGTVQDPDAGNAFYITDAGLEWGGLYDVSEDGEWSSPHQTHRLGVDMDIRSSTIPDDDQDILQEACRGTEKHPRPRVIRCTFESTGPAHLHIEGFYP